MKKSIYSLMLIVLLLLTSACNQDTGVSAQSNQSAESQASQSSAVDETIPSAANSDFSPNTESETTTDQTHSTQTAVFALGWGGGDEKTMRVGDTIGDWILRDLQIDYQEEGGINFLEALFTGEVTLSGEISRSFLMEDGFDFRLAQEDEAKMPCYISPDMTPKDEIWFMLTIPDDIAGSILELEHGEQKKYRITVSDYRFIFAYMTAPASATVISIEEA